MKNLKMNMKKGFSLVELLVVIAVIGVIAAIAIPAMSGIFGKADNSKTARNAQSIVSAFNSARAAGHATSYATAGAAIGAVTTPGTPLTGGGVFADSTFTVSMGADEVTAATAVISPALVGTPTEGTLAINQTAMNALIP